MEDLDPLIIGTHHDAWMMAHRIVTSIHRREMDRHLDEAQKELDVFYQVGKKTEAKETSRD